MRQRSHVCAERMYMNDPLPTPADQLFSRSIP